MRKLLRKFLDWCDRKFPTKVTVTEEKFNQLLLRISHLEAVISADKDKQILESVVDEIKEIQDQVTTLKAVVNLNPKIKSEFIDQVR